MSRCTFFNSACMCDYALYIEQYSLSNVHLIQTMPSSTCNVHFLLCRCAICKFCKCANVQTLVLPSCVIVHSSGQNRDAQPQTILHISYTLILHVNPITKEYLTFIIHPQTILHISYFLRHSLKTREVSIVTSCRRGFSGHFLLEIMLYY